MTKYFEDFLAVDSLDLQVYPGEILALLGPNGAGKTTTIRLLASILKPSEGWARISGMDVSTHPEAVRSRMGILTEHHGLYTRMWPLEYLGFFGAAYGLSEDQTRERAITLIEKYGLTGTLGRTRLGEFSKGMRQKLALIRTLIHDPDIILLDEPTSAMDPAGARQVRESVRSMRSSERAIIVCTHNLVEAEFLADRIAIMSQGRIVAGGTLAELRRVLNGFPVMELRFRGSLESALRAVQMHAETADAVDGRIHFRAAEPDIAAPRIVKQLYEDNVEVLSLAEVNHSLEEVYLQVVHGKDSEKEGGII